MDMPRDQGNTGARAAAPQHKRLSITALGGIGLVRPGDDLAEIVLDALAQSAAAEALTSVLVSINRAYKIPGAGIRITGTPRSGTPKTKEE